MKILIVDDDAISRQKLEWFISSLGYNTISAENGEEAYSIWNQARPRIVITDWMMPVMNGLELCKQIRASEGSQYTYIMLVTSRNNTEDIVLGLDSGADNYITKPYTKEELEAKIRAGRRIIDIESRDTVIFGISKLVESRDYETGGHLDRIRYYSRTIAQHLYDNDLFPDEINLSFVDNIFLTSPLHDIGKIGIPDHILLKTDRLDDDEFEFMKKHTIIGYDTLIATANQQYKADYLQMSAEIALSHHEKYDGSGYPHGLVGEEIPLAARIVALADVYDALVSKRIYKNAYEHDVSKSIILKGRGTHFDPVIVDAFLACEAKFIEIFERFQS